MMLRNIAAGIGAWVIVNVFVVGFLVVEKWLQERAARRREADLFTEWEREMEAAS